MKMCLRLSYILSDGFLSFLVTGVFGMLSAGVLSAMVGYFTYSPVERENNIREKWYEQLGTRTCTHAYTHAHMRAYDHSRARRLTLSYTRTNAYARKPTFAHTHTHALLHAHEPTRAH